MKTWRLDRLRQCKTCPFRKKTDVYEIPNGYTVENHLNLIENTNANDIPVEQQLAEMTEEMPLKVMACHESHESYCLGWIHNQLNHNNIRLRIQLMTCENISEIVLDGEQYDNFIDTLPQNYDDKNQPR